MRAAWMAQEIINTYSTDIQSVNLVPGEDGRFEIYCNKQAIFLRHQEGKFIEIKEFSNYHLDYLRGHNYTESSTLAINLNPENLNSEIFAI